ncbi:MAG: bifunctional [glutamate--ammonia ligase]-adenylyl-L-tyrosine phosphorylase/[glutamate--ammonia-ligase] adenylyltransferase [Gallionellaceae bacterium]|nr:bifunctional [glutamate--ammonia ligase]-adenylyl-L-tyrosine phosphorylase/[glutamate--ammonia-ligase] adenylyltransferase [Gallionellaceae bacterium]
MNTPISSLPTPVQHALGKSRYAQRLLAVEPELADWLRENFATPLSAAEMARWLDALSAQDKTDLPRALRQLRKRVMLKLIARDLGGLANLHEVMRAITALAELSLQRAQAALLDDLTAQYGQPTGETSGLAQDMLVLGMGKLGGAELNVSSDIDLIFVYPEDGETSGERALSNREFFTRLGRRLIAMIDELTADGYVFRVDMRLRPYGDSGPLVMSFAALEEYLVTQGREWERYAWIKARVVSPISAPDAPPQAGDSACERHIRDLMQLAQPFIFRKYLDFSALESMRKLHTQIRQEVQRRDRLNNIKLGPGGIREVEFIAQVFQLIRGGRDAALRIRPTLEVLRLLGNKGQIAKDAVEKLCAAYVFLRNLEHRLQYLDDQQTQDLPEKTEDQTLIAEGMGYGSYAEFMAQLDLHRNFVSAQFTQIFSTDKDDRADAPNSNWRDGADADELHHELAALGYAQTGDIAGRLLQIRNSTRYRGLSDSSRQRFDMLVPQFITLCASQDNRDETLPRMLNLLEAVSRRASYLAFMAEYPQVLERIARIAGASEWASEYLNQHPILLDELLDAREIYRAPDWATLDLELQARLDECGDDTEQQMDALRQFQQSQVFHLLAMDLQNLLSLETLSDHLSDLADLLMRHIVRLCWRDMPKKHRAEHHFAVIAYGKLGGKELGYASDLDLIFLYDDDHDDAAQIYARLAQRINTMLSSYTAAGRLYETDLRLRPNGASGLLVSPLAAFNEYQRERAWVWEHQALTRARFCAGDARVGADFEATRIEVLRRPRDIAALRGEILAMRQKMYDGHPNNSALFDIKHDRGGMVDVEFLVQFLVLAHAHAHPRLTDNAGNLELLRRAGAMGLADAALTEQVCDVYRELRLIQHKMRLNNRSPRIEWGAVDVAPVLALWADLMEEDIG